MDMQNLTEEMNSTDVDIDPNTGANNQKIVPSKFQNKSKNIYSNITLSDAAEYR